MNQELLDSIPTEDPCQIGIFLMEEASKQNIAAEEKASFVSKTITELFNAELEEEEEEEAEHTLFDILECTSIYKDLSEEDQAELDTLIYNALDNNNLEVTLYDLFLKSFNDASV